MQTLEKKINLLKEVVEENKKQREVLKQPEFSMELFRQTIEKKDDLIQKIQFLDHGFEDVYQRVGDTLREKRDVYLVEIEKIQYQIRQITDLTVKIQSQEQENKRLAMIQFGKERKKIHQAKSSKLAASQYYKTMAKLTVIDPQFMDKKK